MWERVMQDYTPIGTQMAETFEKEQFKAQAFSNENFMLAVTPPDDAFFGTNVRNIFIVQKPYGWIDDGDGKYILEWPRPGVLEALERYNTLAEKFAGLTTIFYIDVASAINYRDNIDNESDLEQMMRCTGQKIQEMCVGQEYLEFGGYIEEYVEDDFLIADAELHFGTPAYRLP
jgi:hypothetical protein